MNTLHDYLNALKKGGYRITAQRRAVCDFLARTPTHPTPSDVYVAVRAAAPEISRATVYNTLNALRDLGAIVEISAGGDHTHYDTNPEPHVNLVCLRCGQVYDYAGDMPLTELYETVHGQTGFQAVSAQVQMVGFCAECQARKRDEIRSRLQASASHASTGEITR